jgi:PHD/YefM family antitoxin component YafN of YafNO toxin-antitoxin module
MFSYLEKVVEYNEPLNIAVKNGDVVILSGDEYRSIAETIYLNNIPKMADSIVTGMKTPTKDCVKVDWRNV